MPWPPPYLYGLSMIRLPAAMTSLTTCGADSGAVAVPSALSTAFSPVAGAAGSGCGCGATVTPALTCRRSLRPSERDMRPLIRRWERRSQVFTRRAVTGP